MVLSRQSYTHFTSSLRLSLQSLSVTCGYNGKECGRILGDKAAEMCSLTVKPSCHSWVGSSSSFISFPIKTKDRGSRISFRLDGYDSSKNDGPNTKTPNGTLDAPDYAPGTQKKDVSGEVIRWNNVFGPERIDAKKYIELLEAEIEELNNQVGRKSANGQNELLEYLKSLEPQNLTASLLLV